MNKTVMLQLCSVIRVYHAADERTKKEIEKLVGQFTSAVETVAEEEKSA